MTAIVGILCSDGVVIAADSASTYSDGAGNRIIEQATDRKITVLGNSNPMIVAGSGSVGYHQRFTETVRLAHAKNEVVRGTPLQVGRALAALGVQDFGMTRGDSVLRGIDYSALVAFKDGNGRACLFEMDGKGGFQPEQKLAEDHWFCSIGSGTMLTQPLLALFQSIFWKDGPPDVKGGTLTAYWSLAHACDLNPGGVNYPIHITILDSGKGAVRTLDEHQKAELKDMVSAATLHFAGFKDVLTGQSTPDNAPQPPVPPVGGASPP
jgi:20S proteasome alpha/beta subunit